MDAIDKLALLADLEDTNCDLNHGPDVDSNLFPAVDYVTIPIGKNGKTTDHLLIPVCADCLEALQSDEWTLLYCLDCNSSQWVFQPLAKLHYVNIDTMSRYHIIGLNGCPKCSDKINQIHYLDK